MIFLPYNVPSLKNSKIKTSRGIFPSKSVVKYLRKLGIQKYSVSKKVVTEYKTRDNIFRSILSKHKDEINKESYPIKVGFYFIRDSKRKFDFHNAVQILADLMVAHDLIEDDDMDHFLPFPMELDGKYYHVDRENPGVYIKFNI